MIRVVGVGDNVVDRHESTQMEYPGGNSVNFSVYARMLGHASAYIGVLAEDAEGRRIIRALREMGVDDSMCEILPDGETGRCSLRFIDGDRIISDDNDLGSVKSAPLQLTDTRLAYIRGFDVAHSSCYSFIEDQLYRIHEAGVPLVYDFSDTWTTNTLQQVCPQIDIAFLSGGDVDCASLERTLKSVSSMGCELAIATMGKRGAMVYDGRVFYRKEPYNLDLAVVDTTGAGDSFLTGFITTYIEGKKRISEAIPASLRGCMTEADMRDYRATLIEHAMCVGNMLAVRNCMVQGSFGLGGPLSR